MVGFFKNLCSAKTPIFAAYRLWEGQKLKKKRKVYIDEVEVFPALFLGYRKV